MKATPLTVLGLGTIKPEMEPKASTITLQILTGGGVMSQQQLI